MSTEESSGNREYDLLPTAVKARYTLKEYLWLGDARQATLLQDETEPEWTE
jgi:hypothetical protein